MFTSFSVEPGALLAQPPMAWVEGDGVETGVEVEWGRGRGQGTRWAMHSSNTDESRSTSPGPGHPLQRQGASSPVLSCARPLKNKQTKKPIVISKMAWSKSVRRPADSPLSVLPNDYLFPFPSLWLPFRQWHSVVVTGVGSLGSHLLWKELWSDQMPPWKLKLNCLHFLSFYFNIPAVPAAGVSTSTAAIHHLKAWPSASGKRPTPQKKPVLCFSFFFQSQKNLLIWIQGIATFESNGKQLLGGN